MFPHPILSSEDDEDFVRRSVMRLPGLVEEFFTVLEELHLEGKKDKSREVYALHYTIHSTLKVLLTVPLSSYTKAEPPHEKDMELSLRLQRMGRLFMDDVVGVGPQALAWRKPLTGLAQEAAQHMAQVRIRFPLSASIIRHGISSDSIFFPLYVLVFVTIVLIAVVTMIVVPVVQPPPTFGIAFGCVTSALLIFVTVAAMYFYVMASKTSQLLYMWQVERAMVFGTGMDILHAENAKFQNRPSERGNFVRCGEDTKKGFYAIPYGDDVAYIDGRQVDAQVVMVGFDRDYLITRWNNAAEVMTGFLESGCIGKPLSELVITPSGDVAYDLAELRNSREKVMKVKLRAFATTPVTLFTTEAPITNLAGSNIGGILICANAKDNLGEFRAYIRDYFTTEVNHSLAMLLEGCKTTPNGASAVRCLQTFLMCSFNKQVEDHAHDMLTEWEWTTADQLLARALSNTSLQHTRAIDAPFPATICVHPHVPTAIGAALSATNCACAVMLRMRYLNDDICVLAVGITSETNHKDTKAKDNVKRKAGEKNYTSESVNDKMQKGVEPSTLESGDISGTRVDEIMWGTLCEKIIPHLRSTCGNVQCDGDGITLHFPCQVAPAFDDLDDVNLNKGSHQSIIDQTLAIVNCTVNVLTLITNLVDQHNISMILLKTMFVSLTTVRDRHDLEHRLRSPSDVDVIVCDRGWLSGARDIILSPDQKAIVIPIAEPGVPLSSDEFQYVIQTPIIGSEVRRILMDVGTAVSLKKNAITAREERERILTLRQDSPWTQGKLLGRGAFGAVYEATSDLTGGKMAVKMFYFRADEESSINKLLNEVRIMCSLNHPNIVHYFHCERMDNNVNLFMELCDVSLIELMNDTKPKPPTLSVVQVLRQILTALTYLHTRGVAHRDVKPQNILLKGDVVKLTDFGTALEGEANRDVQGTLRYMAPEVYRGEPHSTLCDIWSVGCLACELFLCPRAFMDDPTLLATKSSTATYLDNATTSLTLMDFLCKCFNNNPELRSTAADLLLHPLLNSAGAAEVSELLTIFDDCASKPRRYSFFAPTQPG